MRIVLTGAGTGGHLFPLVAVARELKKIAQEKNQELELFFLGPADFDLQPLQAEEIKIKTIYCGKLRRYFSWQNFLDLFKIPIGFLQSLFYLFIWMPDAVFSKGGYGALPVVFVAWLFRIPILIHESDVVPGLTNRLSAPLANKIAVSFEKTKNFFPEKKTALTGHPIRKTIFKGNTEKAIEIFNLNQNEPVILIMGGSQGAQPINEIVWITLPELLKKTQIIHICGGKNYIQYYQQVEKTSKNKDIFKKYHLYPFLYENQLKHAYAVSELIISRAGAGSIFEIAACGKPSILIPLPTAASNHQRENAFAYAEFGGTVVLEQTNLTPHLFLEKIFYLLEHPELRQKMSQGALNFAKPNSAQKIALALLKLSET